MSKPDYETMNAGLWSNHACHYGQYGIQFWNGKLIAWDRTGMYQLVTLQVGCLGDAIRKLPEMIAMLVELEVA
ncbi:MAG: hypothetical protein AMXMBFR13_06890 [Phycisphaerae bacterium]